MVGSVISKFAHFEISPQLHYVSSQLMKDLHHPYIVQFLGFSHHQSLKTLSLVMEYLPGGSLEDYVSTHWNVPLHLRQRWSGQMAQALAYLHNRKPGFLIHRTCFI